MSSSLLSPPSQAWETVPELTGTAAENSEMLLQGRKVEVLPPDTSGDYTGGAGEKAQHFRTPGLSLTRTTFGFPSTHTGRLNSPTDSSSRRPSILFWPLQTPTPMCSHPCTDVHIHINKINLKKKKECRRVTPLRRMLSLFVN